MTLIVILRKRRVFAACVRHYGKTVCTLLGELGRAYEPSGLRGDVCARHKGDGEKVPPTITRDGTELVCELKNRWTCAVSVRSGVDLIKWTSPKQYENSNLHDHETTMGSNLDPEQRPKIDVECGPKHRAKTVLREAGSSVLVESPRAVVAIN
jgi:hypothetical protein